MQGEQGALLLAGGHGGVRGETEWGKAMARCDIPPVEDPRVMWRRQTLGAAKGGSHQAKWQRVTWRRRKSGMAKGPRLTWQGQGHGWHGVSGHFGKAVGGDSGEGGGGGVISSRRTGQAATAALQAAAGAAASSHVKATLQGHQM